MGSKDGLPLEKSPHPLSIPHLKEQDFAPQPTGSTSPSPHQMQHFDSDTTATNSSDEFDWDGEEKIDPAGLVKAKRIRWLWLLFMKLSRFLRVLLVGCIGAGVLITPLLVVNLRFRENPARLQVHVWSLWFTIIWSAACITTLVVDAIPYIVLRLMKLFGGQVERLKSQVEVCILRSEI